MKTYSQAPDVIGTLEKVRAEVLEMAERFPLYPWLRP